LELDVNPQRTLRRLKGMAKRMAEREWPHLELVDVEAPVNDDDRAADAGPPPLESFESFYLREFPRLVALARALAGDAHAQDIAQDAMLTAYGKWAEIRDYASPIGWVRGVCSNKAVSAVRRGSAERRALTRLRMRPVEPTAFEPEGADSFWREVRRLPERQAQAAALFYALDMSVADIAVTLDCSEGTVKAHLSRARSTLAERLGAQEGVQ
jgi:RNA polymerase sigma-70 factor (ECF subfamily)